MRKLLLHKLFVYYHSSMKNNIKTNIVLISLIPIFILLVIFYSVLSQNQWLKVQDDVQDLINKSAIFINMELESYLQSSIKIATSAVIRNGLHEDFNDSTEKKVAFSNDMDMIFSNFNDPVYGDNRFIIYHNNQTLFEGANLRNMNRFQDQDFCRKILSLNDTEVIWDSDDGQNICFYRKIENTGDHKSFLEVSISFNKLKNYLEVNRPQNGIISYNGEFILGSEKPGFESSKTVEKSAELINGAEISVIIPPQDKYRIYFVNFASFFSLFLLIAVTIYAIAALLSRSMTKRIDQFITDINDENLLYGHENIRVDDFDEFAEVKKRIKELVTKFNQLHLEVTEAKAEKQSLELELLQSRLNPHLLYNSLSVIKWNAMRSNNKQIAYAIDTLVSYYRDSLNKGKNIVTFRQEINMISKYIKIVEYAHSHHYEFVVHMEEEIMDKMTIRHLLQPIVENAVMHGINRMPDAKLEICGRLKEGKIILQVLDNGCGIEEEKLKEINHTDYLSQYKSYGIKNTRRRIRLYYGEDCDLKVENRPEGGTAVTITVNDVSGSRLSEIIAEK